MGVNDTHFFKVSIFSQSVFKIIRYCFIQSMILRTFLLLSDKKILCLSKLILSLKNLNGGQTTVLIIFLKHMMEYSTQSKCILNNLRYAIRRHSFFKL